MLDDRKIKVLYAIINSYINSAEPIGSRTITKQYDLGVSSATIRNEMSDLEDLGYLNKTHSSSGRIPSDKAYRVYVNELLKNGLDLENIQMKEYIKDVLKYKTNEIDALIQNVAKVLSTVTSCTSMVVAPSMRTAKVKFIRLEAMNSREILMTLVNDAGIIKNSIITFNYDLDVMDVRTLSDILNKEFKGKIFSEIPKFVTEVMSNFENSQRIFDELIPVLNRDLEIADNVDLYYDGLTKLFNFPEYHDLDRVRTLINFLEKKETILEMLIKKGLGEDVDIIIGKENPYEEINDCSLITTTYKVGDQLLGHIGIIGPTRMDYRSIINTMNLFSNSISEIIFNELGGNNKKSER